MSPYLNSPYNLVPDGEVGQQAFAGIREAIRKEGMRPRLEPDLASSQESRRRARPLTREKSERTAHAVWGDQPDGLSAQIPDLAGKCLELLREIIPGLRCMVGENTHRTQVSGYD